MAKARKTSQFIKPIPRAHKGKQNSCSREEGEEMEEEEEEEENEAEEEEEQQQQ